MKGTRPSSFHEERDHGGTSGVDVIPQYLRAQRSTTPMTTDVGDAEPVPSAEVVHGSRSEESLHEELQRKLARRVVRVKMCVNVAQIG